MRENNSIVNCSIQILLKCTLQGSKLHNFSNFHEEAYMSSTTFFLFYNNEYYRNFVRTKFNQMNFKTHHNLKVF